MDAVRARVTVGLLALVSVAALSFLFSVNPSVASSDDWAIIGILATVALVGTSISRRWLSSGDALAPPWESHTLWILPAAMLTPPMAFLPLVALSIALTVAKRGQHVVQRIVISCITVTTTVVIRLATVWIDDFILAAVVGIALLWIVGALCAVAVAHVFLSLDSSALWRDERWSFVQLACAFSGVVVAGAMQQDPLFGFVALAPLLLADFSLRWPELTRLARVDAKTGMPNYQHWHDITSRVLRQAELRNLPAAVLMMDLDMFKSVNDSCGHLAGDQILSELSALVRSRVGSTDTAGRFGGEEFVIALFDRTVEEAFTYADALRQAIADQVHDLSDTSADLPADRRVTCSIGVAGTDIFTYDLTRLVRAADHALGEGKTAGRNRVVVARPDQAVV